MEDPSGLMIIREKVGDITDQAEIHVEGGQYRLRGRENALHGSPSCKVRILQKEKSSDKSHFVAKGYVYGQAGFYYHAFYAAIFITSKLVPPM